MSRFFFLCSLLVVVSLLDHTLAASVQSPFHKYSSSRNITLTFDDLPTHDGFGEINLYHNLDFSSFRLINTSAAAAAGNLSKRDMACATSSDNALVAQRSQNPSLWPRIALNPLAHVLPGEAPFFKVHGLSLKPMNQSSPIVCIIITVWGLDGHKFVRSWDQLSACYRLQYPGGHVNISDIFPEWGRATNMIEMYAQAAVIHGNNVEWTDSPFCVDDLVVEMLGDGEPWEWPKPWWPKEGYPLLPPLAPFKFDDEGRDLMRESGQRFPFNEGDIAFFDEWRLSGDDTVWLSNLRTFGTF